MDERKESLRDITLLGEIAWLVRSGVFAGIAVALVYVGMTYQNVASQREQLRTHEQDQKTDMERIDAKNAAQSEKNAAQDVKNVEQDERIAAENARIAAQNVKNAAQDERIAAQNARIAAQDERLAELKETQVRLLTILEQQGRTLACLEEQNKEALTRLENKVDRMDDFLRGGENSAGLNEEGSAANVSARLCM